MQVQSPGSLSLDSILKISAFIYVHNVSLEPLFKINIDSVYVLHGFLLGVVICQDFSSARKHLLCYYPPVSPCAVRALGTDPGNVQAISTGLLIRHINLTVLIHWIASRSTRSVDQQSCLICCYRKWPLPAECPAGQWQHRGVARNLSTACPGPRCCCNGHSTAGLCLVPCSVLTSLGSLLV